MSETWFKIFELNRSDDEYEKMHGEVLQTLISIRLERELTQKKLAKKSGLSNSMISKIEAQHTGLTLKTFFKYLKGLEMDWVLIPAKGKKGS